MGVFVSLLNNDYFSFLARKLLKIKNVSRAIRTIKNACNNKGDGGTPKSRNCMVQPFFRRKKIFERRRKKFQKSRKSKIEFQILRKKKIPKKIFAKAEFKNFISEKEKKKKTKIKKNSRARDVIFAKMFYWFGNIVYLCMALLIISILF